MDDKSSAVLKADAELNLKRGRPQSLEAWTIVREQSGQHFIERTDDRNERYRAPDGGNFVEGVAQPPFVKQKGWQLKRQSLDRINKDGDVWVATFPKCGTTLMEQIVLLLWNDGDSQKLNPRGKNTYDFTTGVGKVWVEKDVTINGIGGKGDGKGK
uniref:Sulfotransferase domain-containing protein n=1 Tax=Zooxanthella nutricula TaxID=1333877 RepID=A0A7S2VPB5_9DINO|mmetsp:Transcript_90213/g.276280  ORF Transcript_90213/g.276280 Transcript_90213/m.276280 type:complete len:156 (+) Transcript_90213:102-569(+)